MQRPTLNTEDAAAYLRLSESVLRQARSQKWKGSFKSPPFIKVGRRVIYLKEDLDSWLAGFKKWVKR